MTRPGPGEMLSVARVMARGNLMRYSGGRGSTTDQVERSFERAIGVEHCLTVNSGTSALICALVGLGIGPNDEVLVPAYTWVATAAAAVAIGAVPVLVEIDESLTMDPGDLERKITSRSRAVIPVHMLNLVCDMDAIMDVARRHDLVVIEDACQAIGVQYRGRRVGSIGHAGVFSFNQHKNISCGEGGALLTHDDRVHARAVMFHDVGSYIRADASARVIDEPIFVGQNMRMSELGAAVLRPQIAKLDKRLQRRRAQLDAVVGALAPSAAFRRSRHNDEENAMGLSIIFETEEQAIAFGRTRGAVRLMDTHRHVFANWESVKARRTFHPTFDPFITADDTVRYDDEACPRTLDILSRTCSITLDPQIPLAAMRIQAHRLASAAAAIRPIGTDSAGNVVAPTVGPPCDVVQPVTVESSS